MGRLPPPNRIPKNLSGPVAEIEEINVGAWCALPDGKGPMTQVHVRIKLTGFNIPLVMRFKSAEGLDAFIGALQRHRFDVWPGK